MKVVKGILNILGWVVIALLILLCAVFIVNRTKGKQISIFGYSFYVIQSPSMEPTLYKNDLVIVKEVTDVSALSQGDIITFQNDGMFPSVYTTITHRIDEVTEENGQTAFYTKGDNNASQDLGLRTIDEIYGKNIGYIRWVGAIVTYLQSLWGIVTMTIVIVLLSLKDVIYKALFVKAKNKEETS